MKPLLTKMYLLIAGLIMMLVGIYISLMTVDYLTAMAGEPKTLSISLLSDLRGMGGMLLILGIYVFVSCFRRPWHYPALIIAAATYSSFVLFRGLGFVLDGQPEMAIILAFVIELALAGTAIPLVRREFAQQNRVRRSGALV